MYPRWDSNPQHADFKSEVSQCGVVRGGVKTRESCGGYVRLGAPRCGVVRRVGHQIGHRNRGAQSGIGSPRHSPNSTF